MKKISICLIAFFCAWLTSCSNSDISILKPAVVKVNLSTINKPFTFQLNPGDLDDVNESEQSIRLRMYVYDSKGNLYHKQEKKAPNYLSTVSFEISVQDDSYQVVVVSDVVSSKTNTIPQYWSVENENKLNSLTVKYLTKDQYCYGSQEILGLGSIEVWPGADATVSIQPAGALICTYFENIHEYRDVHDMVAFTDRGNDLYQFSSDGSYVANPDLNILATCLEVEDVPNYKYAGSYSYKFLMPQKNMKYSVGLLDSSGQILAIKNITFNIEAGKEYFAHVKLDSNLSSGWSFDIYNVTNQTLSKSTKNINDINFIQVRSESKNSTQTCNQHKLFDLSSFKVIDFIK